MSPPPPWQRAGPEQQPLHEEPRRGGTRRLQASLRRDFRGCLCCLLQAQLWSSVRAGQRAYAVAKHCFVLPWRREETARRRWPIPSRCPWCGLPSNLLESRSFPFSCSFHFLLMFDFNLVFPLLELDTTAFFKETSRKKIFSHDRNKIIAQKSNTLLSVKRKI